MTRQNPISVLRQKINCTSYILFAILDKSFLLQNDSSAWNHEQNNRLRLEQLNGFYFKLKRIPLNLLIFIWNLMRHKKDPNETDGTTGTKIDRKSWLNPTIQGLSKTGVRGAISVHTFLITQNHWKNIFLCSGTLHLAMDFGVVIAVFPQKSHW